MCYFAAFLLFFMNINGISLDFGLSAGQKQFEDVTLDIMNDQTKRSINITEIITDRLISNENYCYLPFLSFF